MGGKKKKGLAHRLAKMSDEERARYMQHKADMEEEARRRKEQLISIFMKNKIRKEDAFARLNNAKLNQDWHQRLRKRKCIELKQDVKNMKAYLDRIMELKQRTIDNLLAELDAAEEQYTNNFQSHLNHINAMIALTYQWNDEIRTQFSEGKNALLVFVGKERQALKVKDYQDVVHMKTIMYQEENAGRDAFKAKHEENLLKKEDILRENKNEFDAMRRTCEGNVNKMWMDIAQTLRDYIERTDRKRTHLAELMALDGQHALDIGKNEETIKAKEEEIKKLERTHANLQSIHKLETSKLQIVIKDLNKSYLEAKQRLSKDLANDSRQLMHLTNHSNVAIKFLEDLFEKGEKILNLSQICRKLETQHEKIVRFCPVVTTTTTTNEENEEDEVNIEVRTPDLLPYDVIDATVLNVEQVERIWINYNRVWLSVNDLRRDRRMLGAENARLKEELRIVLEDKMLSDVERSYKPHQRIVVHSANLHQRRIRPHEVRLY